MDTSKIIRGVVSNGRYTVTAPIVKEDYGLYLKIEGVELPPTYQVDFSNSENNGTSVTMIGNADGVLIPHQFISTGKDVFAFLYWVGADYGKTVYKFRIPNKLRPDRTDDEPTPEEQSVIDQTISALNEAVAQTAQDKTDADASAQSAKEDADRAEQARDEAQGYADTAYDNAVASANSAGMSQTYANNASASASASANSASQSAQIKADVEELVDDAQGYAQASAQSATASANSASQAQGYAQSASASAQSASGYASNAQSSAQTASSKASEASQSASTASAKATEATTAAGTATTAKNDAVAAKTAAETAQGKAETAQGAAEDAAESVSASAAQIATNTADITDLKEGLSAMSTATSSDVGKALIAKTVTDGKVAEWKFGSTGSGSGLTQSQKLAILNCFAHVAWTDAQGQTYYDELEDVLFPPAELTSISATYVNSNPVYTDTDIETLKQYITVTAHYSDGTTSAVNAYTLSGTLTLGTSVLTVAYSEMTTTISVTVSATSKSDMDGWTDGVMYTDIEVIENSYYNVNGNTQNYNNWDRTGKIPCDGASTLLFKANGVSAPINRTYCWFFAQDESPLQKFDTNPLGNSDVSINVPSTAYYFGISGSRSQIAAQLTQGIYPYA